jgi:serine/threonine-protein kinase
MEYLDGFSLEDLVTKLGPLPAGRVIHLTRQICAALAEAHSIGLIHRDIKPANVAICERAGVYDVVKVLDFGLVKELGTDTSSTTTAALTGTPLYLSPEAIRTPSGVDARSDLYAVGAVAYYLLTASHVFEAETVVEVCSHHLHTKPEPPSARVEGVPRDLEQVVLRCLEKSPDDRYASARELEDALLACDAAEEWSDDRAEQWWKTNRAQAVEARPKIVQRPSERPDAVEVDLGARAS